MIFTRSHDVIMNKLSAVTCKAYFFLKLGEPCVNASCVRCCTTCITHLFKNGYILKSCTKSGISTGKSCSAAAKNKKVCFLIYSLCCSLLNLREVLFSHTCRCKSCCYSILHTIACIGGTGYCVNVYSMMLIHLRHHLFYGFAANIRCFLITGYSC